MVELGCIKCLDSFVTCLFLIPSHPLHLILPLLQGVGISPTLFTLPCTFPGGFTTLLQQRQWRQGRT